MVDRWRGIQGLIERYPGPLWVAVGVAGLLLVGWGDYASGRELSFSLFYVLPIALVAWAVGAGAGTALSIAAALVWWSADRIAGTVFSEAWISVWNSAIRLGFFLIISTLISRIRAMFDSQHRLARTDLLTGVSNSRTFMDAVTAELQRARRYRHPTALAFIDIDDFKVVNDRQGHQAGDGLLRSIAQSLVSETRATDLVGRLGGDEFAVLLPETSAGGAQIVADKLLIALTAAYPGGVSIGVAASAVAPDTADQLVRAADEAMYEAKRQGKGRVVHSRLDTEGQR